MKHTHLTDDQLIARCVAGTAAQERSDAADGCASCESRVQALTQLLDEIAASAAAAADNAFPPERLARQHARILHRIEHQGQLGRVIAFPNAPVRRAARPATPARRWVAAAAAAGLAIGLVAGRYVPELPPLQPRASADTVLETPARPELQTAYYASVSEDEFLRQVEEALNSGPQGLQRLERLTPAAWTWEQP